MQSGDVYSHNNCIVSDIYGPVKLGERSTSARTLQTLCRTLYGAVNLLSEDLHHYTYKSFQLDIKCMEKQNKTFRQYHSGI